MKKKRKAVFITEELHERIKIAAHKNNRKIIQELEVRFPPPLKE